MSSLFYSFLRWCPGGLGLFLRQKFYPCSLGACGRKVLFGRFVNIQNPEKIHIGDNVVISDNVTLDADDFTQHEPAIMLGDKVFIGTGSCLKAKDGMIVLRAGSSVGSFCIFESKGNIAVGEHVLLAAFSRIGYCPGHYESQLHEATVPEEAEKGISIMSGCWLGVRSTILPNVSVGEGAIIGAHTVVLKSIPPFVVAVGIPAQIIRNRF